MRIFIFITILIMSLNLSAQSTNCNCCTEKHVEFDFWIGTWTVTNPNGTPAGTNTIDKIQDHCVLR